ncbi:HEPN domain-containing protein [Ktedonosporobacter rubrisoli]|nr:HEPN domain-containing protein [Ktedonosporobacter rubrisoli]
MSYLHDEMAHEKRDDELEQILSQGMTLHQEQQLSRTSPERSLDEDADENVDVPLDSDVQGALGLFAEAAQDMATAGLELNLGRHFACADYCNQVAEKAAQAVSLLRFGRRSMYDHDLRMLGAAVGAPADIQDEMAILTPFHPEAFYAETPPEEADEMISAEQASSYIQSAKKVLRWAKNIVLRM